MTLVILSSGLESHFGICYQLAHIGLVHLSMSSQQKPGGLENSEDKGVYIWLSLLSNLVFFIPRTFRPFLRI